MENLNAEQVNKALECCLANDICDSKCGECQYKSTGADCMDCMLRDALALINSQEQKIKKLTERIERQKTSCRDRWKRLRDEHRCPVCKVKLPDDYKFSYCLECRLKNNEAQKRGRQVK